MSAACKVADSQSASILTLAWLSPKRRAILLCEQGVGFFGRKGGHFTVMVEAQKFVGPRSFKRLTYRRGVCRRLTAGSKLP
jgi:hypothetical protein